MERDMKNRWIALYVENQVGVLAKVSGLFSGKSYNLQSLTVGTTEDETISRMTICVTSDDITFEQIKKQLNRMVEVIKVIDLTNIPIHMKEILFAKVKRCTAEEKAEVFSWNMLGKISRIAVPSILQQSFISIGNIFIQGLINSFGSSVIAGYSAAVKLNTFAITSLTTLGNGTSSFAAQNLGAGKQERVEQGFRASVKLALIITVPFFAAFFFGSHAMLSLFMNEGSTIAMETGTQFLRIVSPFYFVISLKLMADGVLRGAGAMKSFMIATFTDLFLRVILAFLLSVRYGTMGIWLSWPIGWTIAMALSLFFYKKGVWKTGSFTAREERMEEDVMELESESAFLYPEE